MTSGIRTLVLRGFVVLLVLLAISGASRLQGHPSPADSLRLSGGDGAMAMKELPASASQERARPLVNTYNLTILIHPASCTISIGLLTFANGSTYVGAPAGFHQIQSEFCQGQAFVDWSATGESVNRSTANPATLDIEANGTLTATYAVGFNVTFNESGLLFGTTWQVSIEGNPLQSTSATPTLVVFQEPNGSYPYVIGKIPYYAARYAGTVDVDGHSVEVNVTFTLIEYDVEFLSSGLAPQTLWSVTLNGTEYSSHSSWITVAQVNGTYSWAVSWVSGYTANVTSGRVAVAGAERMIYVGFAQNSSGSSKPLDADETYAIVGGGAAAVVAVGAVFLLLRRKVG